MLTGHRPAPAIRHPPIGAVVAHAFGSKNNRPPYVGLAHVPPPAGPGCLICRCGACETGMDREANARDVKLYGEYKNPRTGQPFAIHRHLMLARRLIEAGVRFVTVLYSGAMGWDNHMRIKDAVESGMPAFDHAFAGLIADLDQRGLLDSTLVMVTSEFGRTPRINESAGRDHWARVYSCALAGGGIRRGQVYGASDATAGEPDRDPVTVEDLLATVYHQFGIRAEDRLIVPGSGDIVRGRVVRGLIG